MTMYIVSYKYSDNSGGGVLPFLVTESEKCVIECLRMAIDCYCRDVTFTEVTQTPHD